MLSSLLSVTFLSLFVVVTEIDHREKGNVQLSVKQQLKLKPEYHKSANPPQVSDEIQYKKTQITSQISSFDHVLHEINAQSAEGNHHISEVMKTGDSCEEARKGRVTRILKGEIWNFFFVNERHTLTK